MLPFPHTADLLTPRLRLRAVRETDAAVFHALFDTDEEVWRFDPGHPVSWENRRAWTQRHALEPDMPAGRSGLFGRTVELLATGEIIGAAGLITVTIPAGAWPGQQARGSLEAALFFQLGRAFWGRGYAREAAERLVDFGLREVGLPRVIAATHRDNTRALSLLGGLGFSAPEPAPPGSLWGEQAVCCIVKRCATIRTPG